MDSGAVYRAVAVVLRSAGATAENRSAVKRIMESIQIECAEGPLGALVWINGEDVTQKLRLPETATAASSLSALSEVREPVSNYLRSWADRGFGVMEGRDIGTVILPQAGLKIYITARPEIRAVRRAKDEGFADDPVKIAALAQEIATRDKRDSDRQNAPLKFAEDAILVDTSDCPFEEQVMKILSLASEHFTVQHYGGHV